MSQKERYHIMHFGKTIGRPLVRATAEKPEQAFKGAKALEKEGAPEVQIHDSATGKVYDVAAFGREHRLK